MNRRDAIRLLAAAPALGASLSPEAVVRAALGRDAALEAAQEEATGFEPEFFTAHEWKTVRLLVDLILPADDRGGSATDAGVPEFMDFILTDQPGAQTPMRGGLAWLDTECRERHDASFVDCDDAQRAALLDEISWPDRAPEELSHGVEFFNRFRDLTATGYFSSKMGVEDLQYLGNRYVSAWRGCPDGQLRRLGLAD